MTSHLHAASFVLFGLVATSAIGCVDVAIGAAGVVDSVDKRFTLTGVPTVSLSTFDGRIEVTTWDRPEVQVTIEKHAIDKQDADQMILTAEQNGDSIRVDVRTKDDGFMHMGPRSAHLRVMVPEQAQLETTTGDGGVSVNGVSGELRVKTGDGSIRLEAVKGSVDATTGDGSVDVAGTIGQLKIRSGDGRVRVRALGSGPTSDWSLVTGDGSVVLDVADGFGAELDASTGDGRVNVKDVPFSATSDSHRRNSAVGRIGQGGSRITIRSGDGSIRIHRTGTGEATAPGSW